MEEILGQVQNTHSRIIQRLKSFSLFAKLGMIVRPLQITRDFSGEALHVEGIYYLRAVASQRATNAWLQGWKNTDNFSLQVELTVEMGSICQVVFSQCYHVDRKGLPKKNFTSA